MNRHSLRQFIERQESAINVLADLMAKDDEKTWEFSLFAIMVNVSDAKDKAANLLEVWDEVYDEVI